MFFTEARARGKIACIQLLLVTALMKYHAEAGVSFVTFERLLSKLMGGQRN